MHELKETDREAILLRYFENRQFAEVGAKLGLNENAARMRVERALEKLRAIFARRGIETATAFASVISANAIQIAPANLAATLTTTSIAMAGTGTFTLLKIMTATKIKLAVSAIIVAGAATAFVIQQQAQNKLRAENESLQQQLTQSQTDNENFSNQLASAGDSKKLPDDQFNELLKLRGEVGVLRQQVEDFKKLKADQAQKERDMNEKLSATRNDVALALAKAEFKSNEIRSVNNVKQIGLAFRIFAVDNANQFPTNFDQLVSELGSTNLMSFAQNEIEILNSQIPNLDNYPHAIELRERTPRQDLDGKWKRVYGFVDGSVRVAASDDGNFDAWERANTTLPPQNPNQ